MTEENRKKFDALKQQRLAEAKAKREANRQDADVAVETNQAGRQYQNIFAPTNLGSQIDSTEPSESDSDATTAVETNQAGRQYQNIFAPTNLDGQVDSETKDE